MLLRTQHSKVCGFCKLSPGAPQGALGSHYSIRLVMFPGDELRAHSFAEPDSFPDPKVQVVAYLPAHDTGAGALVDTTLQQFCTVTDLQSRRFWLFGTILDSHHSSQWAFSFKPFRAIMDSNEWGMSA